MMMSFLADYISKFMNEQGNMVINVVGKIKPIKDKFFKLEINKVTILLFYDNFPSFLEELDSLYYVSSKYHLHCEV